MDAKFTRGPWRVRKDENGNTVVATMPEPSDILPGATQSMAPCHCDGTPGRRDKQANAHVMAASPLLYEALKQQLAQWQLISNMVDPDNDAVVEATIEESMQLINNALRAARGEK